jgi:hypothetical protein
VIKEDGVLLDLFNEGGNADGPGGWGTGGLAFGIVAPPAVKGAALEKDCGSDARAVMDAVALDLEDLPGYIRQCQCPSLSNRYCLIL